jgi:hypothetical protein
LRRILEALQIEASYANSAEVTQRSLTLNGEPLEVEILRLGRVALLYRSLDGTKLGKWNQKTQNWEALPARFERPIRQAMEMANQKRAVELVDLPVGPPEVKEN